MVNKIAWWLVIIGGLNWGLVGLGGLFFGGEINLVSMILGNGTTISNIVYLLVGISAVALIVSHCGCKYCKGGKCMDCSNGTCQNHKKGGLM